MTNEFICTDLIWTKNVKRTKGDAWAYMEYNVGDIFALNWARGRANMGKTDASKVNKNELILLFQTVNAKSGSSKGTYLTHIVTPIDQTVDVDENSSHPYTRLVVVVGKNEYPIPKPIIFNFGEPNRGWACNLDLIKPSAGINLKISLAEKQEIFWNLFTEKDLEIKEVINKLDSVASRDIIESNYEGDEKFLIGRHKFYERDPKIISEKKRQALEENLLFCCVCNFDFLKKYGKHGHGFIECHHIIPIAKNGRRRTTLDQLALVCSNCHRMLHRKNSFGKYYSIDELKSISEL